MTLTLTSLILAAFLWATSPVAFMVIVALLWLPFLIWVPYVVVIGATIYGCWVIPRALRSGRPWLIAGAFLAAAALIGWAIFYMTWIPNAFSNL